MVYLFGLREDIKYLMDQQPGIAMAVYIFVENYGRIIGKRGFYICRFQLGSQNSIGQPEKKFTTKFKPSHTRAIGLQITTNQLHRKK